MEGCARTFCCMAEVQCIQCACGQRQEQLSGLYRACAGAVARWLAAANGLKQGHTHIAPHGVPEGLAVALGLGYSHSLTCAPCSTQRTRCLVHLHVLQAQPCSWRHVSWARALRWKARSASTGNDCLHVLAAVQQMLAAKADLQSTSRTWEWVALALPSGILAPFCDCDSFIEVLYMVHQCLLFMLKLQHCNSLY